MRIEDVKNLPLFKECGDLIPSKEAAMTAVEISFTTVEEYYEKAGGWAWPNWLVELTNKLQDEIEDRQKVRLGDSCKELF